MPQKKRHFLRKRGSGRDKGGGGGFLSKMWEKTTTIGDALHRKLKSGSNLGTRKKFTALATTIGTDPLCPEGRERRLPALAVSLTGTIGKI